MRALILRGGILQKQEYIDKYISDNDVPLYNIERFDEEFKISDARNIKRSLGTSSLSGKKRLFVISCDPNTESQNALLKTLEELDEATDFIFAGKSELLPTVVSRSNVVVVLADDPREVSYSENMWEEVIEQEGLEKQLQAIDKVFTLKKEDPLSEIILGLRQILFKKIISGDVQNIDKFFRIYKDLTLLYSVVISNNLNPRLVAQRVLAKNN